MAKLEYKGVIFDQKINDDAGSGAYTDLATWKPDLPDGWFYLAPGASEGHTMPSGGAIVRPLEPGVLADVVDWVQVWNDAGSGKPTDFALWRGVGPTPEYIVVGGFFTRSHNKPTREETEGIQAIHISALYKAVAGSRIWTDAGTGSKEDASIWDISNWGGPGIATGAFVPVKGFNDPPKVVYSLNRDHLRILE